MTTLISFLGKGKANPLGGYVPATYRFDASFSYAVPFFGLALTKYLKPDRLIVVGTRGSIWDVFFDREGHDDDARLQLMAAVEEATVTEAMLDLPRQQLADQLRIRVDCLLIPYAQTADEQVEILRRLAEKVQSGERLWLDVTHGFRHLPMLALVAARYLARVVGVKVEEIFYGALEMTPPGGETPVLRLKGLLAMLDWVDALATYDKDGDYSVFAPLLVKDGMPEGRARLLAEAAYCERTSNPELGVKKLRSVLPSIETHDGPLGGLFRETLKERIGWSDGPTRHHRELSLADAYLKRSDYLRAATFLYEAFVTRTCYARKLDGNNRQHREEADESAKQETPAFRDLKNLRNALAHGVRSPGERGNETVETIADESRLHRALKALRNKLL